MRNVIRWPITLVAAAVLATACSADADTGQTTPSDTTTTAASTDLAVAVASFDLAVEEQARFIAGLLTPEREMIGFGRIQMRFAFLGEDGQATPAVGPASIDSRATSTGQVPDPVLHDTTVADAVAAGRPTVVVISTPVYCVSRFCGPITETVEALAERYGDRAEFIHLEVWKDFDTQTINDAAEWILTDDGGNEPWTFLVDPDGTIAARWDNVVDVADLEGRLGRLPVIADGA